MSPKLCSLIVAGLGFALTCAQAADKRLLLLAGSASHGSGEHEFKAGCALLKACLDKVPGLQVVMETGGWPKDEKAFDGVDAVFIYSDGGGGHPFNRPERLAKIESLAAKGVGIGAAHYAVEVPKGPAGEAFLKWIGGYFEMDWSVNPHWTAEFKSLPTHPVTRGVSPFGINDEWYYHMRFPEGMKGTTPILTALPPPETLNRPDGAHSGNPAVRKAIANQEPQHVMWVTERADGGRGFGFTGGHFHRNWANDDFRTLILNSLLWIAKMEVPSGGVTSSVLKDQLVANLDAKGQEKAPAQPATPAKGSASPIHRTGTFASGHRSFELDIQGAKELWLVVTDGGDGIGCDWANWAEPTLVGPGGVAKLTDLKWKDSSSGWGNPNINKNAGGQPMRIAGKSVPFGIGTHSPSVIHYDLADGNYSRFKSWVGPDNGGTDQGCGSTVEFAVYTAAPDPATIRSTPISRPPNSAGVRSGREAALAQLKQMTVPDGLEVTLFASEPMVRNPASMDIDSRGRVWVTEGANYRLFQKWGKLRPEGDRIVILEDTDGDGVADKEKTFYQGNDINTALGICVLGNKVIVSCSPNVFIFTDKDGDDVADDKQVFFTGISGVDHDHGVHSFTFGPDGKLYFNQGNDGRQIKRPDGGLVVDRFGRQVATVGKPFRQGLAFRCNPDGSDFEVLGHNFRNNYEVCVDSFGRLWQSDNDDDGNKAVRINNIVEYGNYGFTDEMTGAGWSQKRTNMEEDIPSRHWHLNDPGVVPNLILTGAGSPTGILFYEGKLLPEVFQNQIIHCDAGPRAVRSYVTTRDGAGYQAKIVDLLTSQDTWYRPSDVCAAPDGSIYIADWNDAGVGGHNMADQTLETMTGRVYRVAPKGHKPSVPKFSVETPESAAAALGSPNLSTRHLAWTALSKQGAAAEKALLDLWNGNDLNLRARAWHLLARVEGREAHYLELASIDKNEDIRALVPRHLMSANKNAVPWVARMVKDSSPLVRRECAVALYLNKEAKAADLWAELALQHDGKDRWYLEALGIGAFQQDDRFFAAWLAKVGDNWNTPAGRDIVWRTRSVKAPAMLVKLIADKSIPEKEKQRYFRALDFISGPEKEAALVELLTLN